MTNLTLRSVKGSPLTNNEVDTNFSNLDSDKVEQTAPTGSIKAPSGTTAQRDGAPVNGYFRYNATSHSFEGYINGGWSDIGLTYSAGAGLSLSGTEFNIGAGTGITVNADTIAIGQSVDTAATPTFAGITVNGGAIFDSAQVNGIVFKSPDTTHTMTLDIGNDDILRLTNGINDLITIQDSGGTSTTFSVQDFSIQNGATEYFKVDASTSGTIFTVYDRSSQVAISVDSDYNVNLNNTAGITTFANHAIKSQTLTTTSTSQTAIATFAHADYIGAEVVITAKDGTASHITRLNVVHNGTTASSTEYGSVFTGSSLSTYDVDISGTNLRILATPASTNSTVFKVALTLMVI